MKKQILKIAEVFRIPALLICFTGCATMAQFGQYAYTQTISLNVDALNIMGTATDKFSSHQADATAFKPL
ncbi:hypothetical protein [Mucilaginibacter sp.]|uniref:hypothetical protein n=1 Tax=Mucilaginibacter sp. TaxID=1882438 RepID=UPI003B006501